MAVSLKHTFQSAKADGADATLVRPSNWNAEHTITAGASSLVGNATATAGAAVTDVTLGLGLAFSGATLTTRNVVPQPSVTSATATLTTEQIIVSWAIPANRIAAGAGFKINVVTQTAAASLLTFRVRVGAAGTTADTQTIIYTQTAAQVVNAYQNVQATLFAVTSTQVRGGGFVVAQAAVLGTVTAANVIATIVPTATVFITVSVAEATTAGVVNVIAADLTMDG